MGKLTEEQRTRLTEFLLGSGLTFKPLRDEMLDHVSCDLEVRMDKGLSFEQAWSSTIAEIPDNHFQQIQKETMETIDKRFSLSTPFSYLALGLLFVSTTLKIMHFPGAGELLLLSFAGIAISLLTGSLTGIKLNKEKKGGMRVMAVVVGVLFMMAGYGFKILHLPGADQLIAFSVVVLIGALLANTLYVYRNASGEGNLLTYLHEKYTPGIERFFLILLYPLAAYKVISLTGDPAGFAGNLVLLVILFGGGLQFFALCWRIMEKDLTKRNPVSFAALIIIFLSFNIIFLGPLVAFQIRIVLIMVFSAAAAVLAYYMESEPKRVTSLIFALVFPVIFFVWGLIRLQLIHVSAGAVFFNLPVLVLLGGGILLCRKHGPMRTYVIISFGSYLFEYIYS
ncbi:MAG TPA: hypothetical protein VEB86_10235 [Chryseosolibacter sp.]|nr:hypothetical protein [Chryseosolibacter sp.]